MRIYIYIHICILDAVSAHFDNLTLNPQTWQPYRVIWVMEFIDHVVNRKDLTDSSKYENHDISEKKNSYSKSA